MLNEGHIPHSRVESVSRPTFYSLSRKCAGDPLSTLNVENHSSSAAQKPATPSTRRISLISRPRRLNCHLLRLSTTKTQACDVTDTFITPKPPLLPLAMNEIFFGSSAGTSSSPRNVIRFRSCPEKNKFAPLRRRGIIIPGAGPRYHPPSSRTAPPHANFLIYSTNTLGGDSRECQTSN